MRARKGGVGKLADLLVRHLSIGPYLEPWEERYSFELVLEHVEGSGQLRPLRLQVERHCAAYLVGARGDSGSWREQCHVVEEVEGLSARRGEAALRLGAVRVSTACAA